MSAGDRGVAEPTPADWTGGQPLARSARQLLWRTWKVASLPLGAIGLFNLVARREELIELSQSLHFLVGWWRYLTYVLFSWIHLNLDGTTRDAIVLLLVATGAVNVKTEIEHHRSVFVRVIDLYTIALIGRPTGADVYEPPEKPFIERRDYIWRVIFIIGGSVALLFILRGNVVAICTIFLTTIVLFLLIPLSNTFPSQRGLINVVAFPISLLSIPMLFYMSLLMLLADGRKYIALTAGLCASLLLTNALFVRLGDPLLQMLQSVPSAPPRP
jgi:hypothetical protein